MSKSRFLVFVWRFRFSGNAKLQFGMSSTLSSLLRALCALRAKPSFFFLCALCALRANPSFFLSLCPPCSPGNAGLQSGMSSTFSSFLRALCELLGTPHFSPACLQRFHPSSTPSARTLLFSFSVSSVFSVRTLLFSFSVSSLRTPLFFLRAPAGDFKSQRSSCYTL